MAKGTTRLQKHYATPVQRKFTTFSNTKTTLRKVVTLVSNPEATSRSDEAAQDLPPASMDAESYSSVEGQPDPLAIEVDCPAGIRVRPKAPRNENSVSSELLKRMFYLITYVGRTITYLESLPTELLGCVPYPGRPRAS